jgi:hypothetical protein
MDENIISTREVRELAKAQGLLDPTARGVLPKRVVEWWARTDGRKIVADRSTERAKGIDMDTGDPEDDAYWRLDRKLSGQYRRHVLHEDGPSPVKGCEWCAEMEPHEFGQLGYTLETPGILNGTIYDTCILCYALHEAGGPCPDINIEHMDIHHDTLIGSPCGYCGRVRR